MFLERINKPNDIKRINRKDYFALSEEIRSFLVEKISENGGHLASNLGVVELTMALHLALNLPQDKIIWDVGHQSYTHKILTGRRNDFHTLREYGGMSGFPKKRESECDVFNTGHSSTSISAGLGIVLGNQIQDIKGTVVSVIGDGALTGGMAYEALNNASQIKKNFIIILNDNNMSISENVGGINTYLSSLRTGEVYNGLKTGITDTLNKIPVVGNKLVKQMKRTKSSIKQMLIPGMLFEDMGIPYLGPIDGHNILQIVRVLREAMRLNHTVMIHVITKKGKGYPYAERRPAIYHGIEPFDKTTGQLYKRKKIISYTEVFSGEIVKLAKKDKKIAAITAAMPEGTGLRKFRQLYPERFFDVGIAEEHAVTFAAGLATSGLKPFVVIYSSFLQRAYDQILHDVCMQNLSVIFMLDRSGLVGQDGETHQGVFDISYLSNIPNMNIFAPKNKYEFIDIIRFASEFNGPLSIRYPKGEAYYGLNAFHAPIVYAKSEVIFEEKDIAILAVGSMVRTANDARDILKEKGYHVTLVNVRFVKPIDESLIDELVINHDYIVTIEENIISGGYGESVLRYSCSRDYHAKVINIAIPNQYINHGDIKLLKKEIGLDQEGIIERILSHI